MMPKGRADWLRFVGYTGSKHGSREGRQVFATGDNLDKMGKPRALAQNIHTNFHDVERCFASKTFPYSVCVTNGNGKSICNKQ